MVIVIISLELLKIYFVYNVHTMIQYFGIFCMKQAVCVACDSGTRPIRKPGI